MSFEDLIAKVDQAEKALEANERRVAADWRQLKGSWREAWTPGRIVLAGLVTGFFTGRARPLGRAGGGGVLQMITALSGLFAGSSAQAAAGEAEHAAHTAEQTAAAVPGVATHAAARDLDDIHFV
ncbi:MAG: hypothetical protein WKF61_10645 [Luteimonas sp.]